MWKKSVGVDGGVVLCSVGFDGNDYGGVEEADRDDVDDITFCLGGAHASRRLGLGR